MGSFYIMRRRHLLLLFLVISLVATDKLECPENCQCKKNQQHSLKVYQCSTPLQLNKTFSSKMNDIESIILEDVTVSDIGTGAFLKMDDLQNVYVKNSVIKNISKDSFDSIEITALNFVNCSFANEPYIVSADLEELEFTNCSLKKVPKLDNVEGLLILDLDGNYISEIAATAFKYMADIEEIYLSNNNLSVISPDLFKNNLMLNTLYLENNNLKYFEINNALPLEKLCLKSNELISFKATNVSDLTYIDLSNNLLKKFSLGQSLKKLTYINLSNNKINKLDGAVFQYNTNLEKIILDGNSLRILPIFAIATEKVFDTYHFSCSNCNLQYLHPETFKNMPSLVELRLSNNNLKSFQTWNLPRLSVLHLSKNGLEQLNDETFTNVSRLSEITLSKNPLTSLNPEAFSIVKGLTLLDVTHCSLEKLWSSKLSKVNSLQQLKVDGNKIKQILLDDLEMIPNVKFLSANNNPISCDPDFVDTIKWLTSKNVSQSDEDLIKTHEKLIDDVEDVLDTSAYAKKPWYEFAMQVCSNNPQFLNNYLKNVNVDHNTPKISNPEVVYEGTPDIDVDLKPVDPQEEALNRFIHMTMSLDKNSKILGQTANNDEIYKIDDDDLHDDYDDELVDSDEVQAQFSKHNQSFQTTQASYIISITTVFVLTALIVLAIAVTTILLIMKRQKYINMPKTNIPRFKILTTWDGNFHKKHSGSIYRPLSEEISPPTPKISRYEFNTTPAVHAPQV